jgi:hypothetical protein
MVYVKPSPTHCSLLTELISVTSNSTAHFQSTFSTLIV